MDEADAIADKRQRLREQAPWYNKVDGTIEVDADLLFEAVRKIFADAYADTSSENPLWHANRRAEAEDLRHGDLAALIAHAITRGYGDRKTVAAAHEILESDDDDPRLKKIRAGIERLADDDSSLSEFERTMKGLIPRRHVPPPAPANALPLTAAKQTLEQMLETAEVAVPGASFEDVWRQFILFAQQPFAPPSPLHVDGDICLFEWSAPDSTHESELALNLVRQFSLYEDDGGYDHMEQVILTLRFRPSEVDVSDPHFETLWSGEDLSEWIDEVETFESFAAMRTKQPLELRIDHSDV